MGIFIIAFRKSFDRVGYLSKCEGHGIQIHCFRIGKMPLQERIETLILLDRRLYINEMGKYLSKGKRDEFGKKPNQCEARDTKD